ncbi:hypothetical protein [Butyricimonas paravirosa]|uniref:hypothetical protein n=1 Tax=Butyricimonas paravirosa TaxID=1472417 RepID=UPI00210A8FF7|nr:hypothetical protein [Butyricimonas paravirosa]MCQ4875404.1 hypothetical protein [Butyricimonas paravirosa]
MSTNTFYTKYLNNKNLTYLCLAIIICFFIINYLNIFDFKPDLNGDNVYYYALGRALAAGKGYTDIIFFEETPHSHFPPGYPLFNAGIILFTHSYSALKIANGVLFGLSILLLFFLTKKLSGNLLLTLSTCLLCCMQQALLRYSTIVMSEMLFTFLTIGVLYLISLINTDHLFDKHRPRSQIIYFILMIIGLNYIYFVRTMGTSIILAVIIYFGIICIKKSITFFKSKRTHADLSQQIKNKQALFSHLIILGIVIVSFAGAKTAWDMRNKSIGVTGSDYLKDFKKKPKGETMTTFSDWTERVENNLTSYVGKWIPSAIVSDNPELEQSVTRSGIIQGICILAIVLLGLITLKKLQLLLFLYIGITMAVLMVWPEQYGGHRYFIGIIPLFIFLFLNGCLELINFITKKMPLAKYQQLIPAGGLILLLVFFMFPHYTKALKPQQNFATFRQWNERIADPAFIEYIYAIDWCKKNLPEDARIACRKPELFYLFSGGRKSTSFPQYAKPEELFERFKKQQISHVIIDRWFRHGYVTVYPMVKQYPDHFRPLIQVGKNTAKQLPTLVFQFFPNAEKK